MLRNGFLLVWFVACSDAVAAQSPKNLASKPLKVDIESKQNWQVLGDKPTYDVVLKDARNRTAVADHPMSFEVTCKQPFPGSVPQKMELQIKPGDSKSEFTCDAKQAGPLQINAKHKYDELLGGKAVIFVTSEAPQPKAAVQKPVTKRKRTGQRKSGGARLLAPQLLWPGVRLLSVAQTNQPQPAAESFRIALMPGETETLANGSSPVQLQVCFTQGGWSHPETVVLYAHEGGNNTGQLVIAKNAFCGQEIITSHSPGQVKVKILDAASSGDPNVHFQIDPPIEIVFTFHKVIADFRLEDPRPSMSLIDSADLVARFYDENNHVTSSGEDRVVTFSLVGAGLFSPHPVTVHAADTEARTSLFPTYWGQAQIYAATKDLSRAGPKTIAVAVWTVLLLAVFGGAIGALVGFRFFRNVLWWRVFIGIVTGLFLVWLATSGFVTKLSPTLVHNLVSGFFLSIVGGYIGLPVIDWFVKLIGFKGVRAAN